MVGVEIFDNDWKYKLTNLVLHQKVDDIYLEATYETECKREKGILHIPRIPLYIAKVPKINVYDTTCGDPILCGSGRRYCEVNLGFGDIYLEGNGSKKEPWFTYQVTEEKVEELTLEEIEQKLGHKVKIVSDKK